MLRGPRGPTAGSSITGSCLPSGTVFSEATLCLGWGNATVMVYSIWGLAIFTGGLTWVDLP